jgi:hypothetical protein
LTNIILHGFVLLHYSNRNDDYWVITEYIIIITIIELSCFGLVNDV